MWLGVLGPLLVRDGDTVVDVPKGRLRVLLAALVVRAGTVVSADALAEVVWDGSPPAGAVTTLRSYVRRLREGLGPAAGARVVTRYPGYLLQAGVEEVDLLRFGSLSREGGAAARAGQWEQAWELLGEGLGLWRGEPLADVPSDLLRREQVPGLEESRLQAAEWRVDAGLQLGRHGDLVGELQLLAAAHPLRERFHGQLMVALVRCGRQAEALQAYQRARAVLVDELGTEPGAGLRKLHQQILTGDPALAEPAVLGADHRASLVPRELPAAVAGFAGRAGELAALTGLLDQAVASTPPTVVIPAIGGTAGVGKTALAVQWAHTVTDRFPDGQLYVNLRGYDPDRPMPSADALARFLRVLGVPGQDIPAEEDERAARYRSLLAGRKMLVVLDNAGSVEQVRPLLPGSPSCVVVVTSRDALAGLVARHGAVRLELDLLPAQEAVGLLRALIGLRAENEPGAAVTLAAQCCRLPLALRVAAELAAARPDVPLAELAGELADQQSRLDLLDAGGDPRTAVRAVFSWSYRHLDHDAARVFRLAGLHPGPDVDPYAVAALTGTGSLGQNRAVLDALARAHLIQSASPGRYSMHDLLRAYARELSDAPDGDEQQRAALTRLFDHYLHTASAAMDALYPAERERRPRIPPPDTPAPPVTESDAARAWLDVERPTLVAVTVHAAGRGWPTYATRLSATLYHYLDSGGHYPEAITIHSHARVAAQRTGDQAAEAIALTWLGSVHWRQSRYQQAADHLRQALALFRQVGDRAAQGRTLNNLGVICDEQGRYQEAIGFHRQALAIHREIGDSVGRANALNSLASIEERLGLYDLSPRHYRRALAIATDIGARDVECIVLINLGPVGLRQGRYRQAARHLRRALALSRETGYQYAEAAALTRTGDLCLRQDHPEEAVRYLQEALALHRESGHRSGEADALNSLGDVRLATGRPGHARAEYDAALALAAQTGDKYQQARAHHGLGQACHASGDRGTARRHWQQALAMFAELGTPEADQVRAELASSSLDTL
jgi:DNA-binding SARP family transcriptional activator/tetratricopeptide (TPR) repeat protein